MLEGGKFLRAEQWTPQRGSETGSQDVHKKTKAILNNELVEQLIMFRNETFGLKNKHSI